MGFPQNPVVVLSSLSAAAAAVGALKRWTRGRGQRCIPEEEEAEKSVLVDQVKEAANVGESQVWLTSQVNCSEAVKGEWDDESSRKVAVNSVAVQGKGRDDASLQKEVADCGEGGEDGVSSQEEGMGLPKFLFKAQQDDLALAGRELDQEARSTHARWGLEGPVQQDKMNAALLAAVPPQDELAESHKTPKKERYVDIEAEKDRGESPERTPTSVLKIFPDSPESNSGELSFPGPMRGGGRGTAWTRGPIFGDRPSDTLEGGLLPLFVQLGKVGGDKGRHALNLGAGGLDDTSERRDHEGGRVGCTMGGARRTQSDGGVVGFGKRSRAAQFAERQLSLQISVHVSAGESEEPGSDSSSAPHAEAAVSKPGGNKQGEAQPRVGESADETVRGAQKSLFDEGDRGTAYQGEGRQGMPREGKDLLAERRQSGSGSDTCANTDGRKPQQGRNEPSFHASIDLGSNKASGFQSLAPTEEPPPSDLQGGTTSQVMSHHGVASLEGSKPASENHRTPQAAPAPAFPLVTGSSLAKPGSTDGFTSATRDFPIQRAAAPGAFWVKHPGWANPEQDLDGFDSATESFATPAASTPTSPRVNQPNFANPKMEASAGPPTSKCDIEEVASGPANMVGSSRTDGGQSGGVSSGEVNGVRKKELEKETNLAAAAACAWCGGDLVGDNDELALCCMLALQKLREEAKANGSGAKVGAVASKAGTAVRTGMGW